MSDPAYEGLTLEREGAILIVTLDKPAEFNALDVGMIDALNSLFETLQDEQSTRVVVLRGTGKHFCAGLNLKGHQQTELTARNTLHTQKRIGRIVRLMRSCPQPIVALGHGAAAGGGMSLMLGADVRYGTPDLRMNAAYVKIGLGGADIASSYFLPRLVNAAVAAEMLLTGRFVGAERLYQLGLLAQIVEPDALLETGMAAARDLLGIAPMALRLTKEVLNFNIDAPGLDAAMALEDRQQVMLTTTRDHPEAVAAFLEKRPPLFQDR